MKKHDDIVRVYLSGPMTGLAQFNYPAFFAAARTLIENGYEVYNPAARKREDGGILDTSKMTGHERLPSDVFNIREAFREYAEYITTQADAVAVLPDWQTSKGAVAEVMLGRSIGLPTIDALTGEVVDTETVLGHAAASNVRPGETGRAVSVTGATKGTKECRIDLIPPTVLHVLGVVFGRGAAKYADHNWLAGYPTSLSYSALLRHLNAWNYGEDIDADQGVPHLGAAMFHLCVLLHTTKTRPEFDDRADWTVDGGLDAMVEPTPDWIRELLGQPKQAAPKDDTIDLARAAGPFLHWLGKQLD